MKFSWKNIENWRSPENDFCLVFLFFVFGYWVDKIFCFCFCFSVCKTPRRLIWGSIYSCTMDGFFRIFKKAVSELICTRLYLLKGNKANLWIQLVTVRQNLGMLLQNKLNQKLKLSKNIFYKNVLLNYYSKREKIEKHGWFLTWSFTN